MNLNFEPTILRIKKMKLYCFSSSNKLSFWFSTYNGRRILRFVSSIVCWLTPRPKIKEFEATKTNIIEEDQGFITHIQLGKELDRELNFCRDIYLKHRAENQKTINTKTYLSEIELSSHHEAMRAFVKLALNKSLINTVTDYFGEIPIINEIRLFHSENKNFIGGSQLFHIDKECHKSFKVFLSITDNDNTIPNQSIIDAKTSRKIFSKFGKNRLFNRFEDSFIKSHVEKNKIHNVHGKMGDMWGLDVCNCIHNGSRPSETPRTLLWIMYLPKSHYRFPYNIQSYKKMDLLKFAEKDLSIYEKYILTGKL